MQNVHQVMKAEDLLDRAQISCDLQPVPREISSECGMALVFDCSFSKQIEDLLSRSELSVTALYRIVESGYEKVFDLREERRST